MNMDYAEKLKQFNGTLKYKAEQRFLTSSIGAGKLKILDYGCGLGASVMRLNAYTNHCVHGFDIEKHNEEFSYTRPVDFDLYDVIYFMHSIAHIQYLEDVLKGLKVNLKPGGRIIVITPNLDWLNSFHSEEGYKPDHTVFKHYNMDSLSAVFKNAGFQIDLVGQFGEPSGYVNERIFLIAK